MFIINQIKIYKLCFLIIVEKKILVVLDVSSIKELATEKVNSINITSEGEKRPYYITNGEVILSNEQMKEILKNL